MPQLVNSKGKIMSDAQIYIPEDDWNETPDTTSYSNVSYNKANDAPKYNNDSYGARKNTSYTRHPTRSYQGTNWRASAQDNDKSNDRTYMTVSSQKVGKIIGRQGVKIKELQSSSGTHISIGKEDYDGNVKLTISGTPEGQEKCKEMIKELVDDSGFTRQSMFSAMAAEAANEERSVPVIDWDAVNKASDEFEKKRWLKCPPLKKDFYFESPEVANMDEEYVRRLRESLNNITVGHVFGGNEKIPNPVETFEQAFAHYPEIMDEINKQGFDTPFPIQCQAWPVLLSGKDMIGIAQTGTGKTLAFLLPALIHTDGQESPLSERGGPNVLVLAPTRELALQIEKEVQKYSYRNIKSVCVYGGGNRREQINQVTKGVQIVIATPGRLNDLVEAGVINVESITFLILDEADRMLDMGFEPQIRKILLNIRPDKQTVMTSATWPFAVQNLAQKYMKDPIQVVIGSLDLAAVHSVKQTILVIQDEEKTDYLMDFISSLTEDDKVIIFVDKKALADSMSCDLILQNIDCQSIHGDREQVDREQAIEDLKTGSVRILIATDVASRGIDITDVTKVLNYDFPRNIEEYVHRVGRTGRAGKTGEAVTFFTRNDWSYAKELISILEEANQAIPEELYGMRDRFEAMKERRKTERPPNRGNREFSSGRGRMGNDHYRGGGFRGRGPRW